MNLYELTTEFKELINLIENEEIPAEAIEDTLQGIQMEIEDKIDNCACVLKQLNAEIDAIKSEEQRLKERRESKQKKAEWLKNYISHAMTETGKQKIETARNVLSFRKSEAVEIKDDFIGWAMQNAEHLLSFGKPSPRKELIKEIIKNGGEVTGAEIKTNYSLQVK